MSEMVRSFFSPRNKMASTKPSPWSQMLADVCCTLFSKRQSLSIDAVNLFDGFFFQMKRYFEAQTTTSFKAESKLTISSSTEFAILHIFRNSKMSKWHIWFIIDSWSLTASIWNSVRGRTEFWKITMTSGRRNLHSPFSTPLPPLSIIDHRPPP